MTGPLRPNFIEGQILGAADLNAQVQYDRLGAALHERTEHMWGVAQGLVLTPKPNTTGATPYVDIDLAVGRAVDQLGRAIVVMAPLRLQVSDFQGQVANPDKAKFYPVFVQTVDVGQVGDTQPGKCSVSVITRYEESVQVSYGNPGSELTLLDQVLPTVADGLDTTNTPGLTAKVLVGWVQYDKDINGGQFTGVNTTAANNTTIHYVGVVASDVVAGGGVLTLHTRPDGKRFVLSITENATGATLAFGQQDGSNPVVPTFTVDEKGNVTCSGALHPGVETSTLAESGLVFDGARLPLPPGVADADLTSGKYRVHISLTPPAAQPRPQLMPDGTSPLALPLVESCSVDSNRVLSCSIRWIDTTAFGQYVVMPAACTYLIVASGA